MNQPGNIKHCAYLVKISEQQISKKENKESMTNAIGEKERASLIVLLCSWWCVVPVVPTLEPCRCYGVKLLLPANRFSTIPEACFCFIWQVFIEKTSNVPWTPLILVLPANDGSKNSSWPYQVEEGRWLKWLSQYPSRHMDESKSLNELKTLEKCCERAVP